MERCKWIFIRYERICGTKLWRREDGPRQKRIPDLRGICARLGRPDLSSISSVPERNLQNLFPSA